MTSNINFWMNIPSLYTGSSKTSTNATTASDFASYLLHTTASANKTNSTSSSVEALLSELSYEQKTTSTSSLTDLFSDLYGTSNPTKMTTPTMSDYLQNIYQAQQLKTLSTAKEKLQTEMMNFAASVSEKSSLADQQKLAKMQSNISSLNDYITTKTSITSGENNLWSALTNSTSTSSNLLSAMSASSALSQYLLTK